MLKLKRLTITMMAEARVHEQLCLTAVRADEMVSAEVVRTVDVYKTNLSCSQDTDGSDLG